jgi:hypothetical protein
MAHVLHDGHHRDDDRDCSDSTGRHDRTGRSDCTGRHDRTGRSDCTGRSDRTDCTGDVSGISDEDRRHRRRRRRRRERQIPVGTISIDCSPVSFRTPGQARNVVSCPFTVTEMVTEVQTTVIETPIGNGCVLRSPVTQAVQVPVTTTVNCPGVLIPIPQIVCPANVLCAEEQICPPTVAANTNRKKGCGCR